MKSNNKARPNPTTVAKPKPANKFYHYEERKKLKKLVPQLNNKEILAVTNRKWVALSDEEKEKYINLANEDLERFAEEKKD